MKNIAFLALILCAIIAAPGCRKTTQTPASPECTTSEPAKNEQVTERISGGYAWGMDEKELDVYRK